MILILAVVLLILMILIGGDRGAKSFIALVCNIIALISGIYLIISGVNPILVTILGTIVFCQITLIYQNGHNLKTYAARKVAGTATSHINMESTIIPNLESPPPLKHPHIRQVLIPSPTRRQVVIIIKMLR